MKCGHVSIIIVKALVGSELNKAILFFPNQVQQFFLTICMAQFDDFKESKSDSSDDKLSILVPQTKFEINYKDKNQLIKDVHYVANQLYPLTTEQFEPNSDVSKSSYKSSVIQGGITNLLYLMTPKIATDSNGNANTKLLVRIYGENTEVLIDRQREEQLFYELGNNGFGPKLYGLFGNGRIEQFYDNAHSIQLHQRKHCKKICKTLAAMHSIHPILLKEGKSQSVLWKTLDKWYNIAKDVELKENEEKQKKYEGLDWQNIPKQMSMMQCILLSDKNENDIDKLFDFIIEQQLNDEAKEGVKKALNTKTNRIAYNFMFDIVFCHNDLLGGNILHLEDTKEIKFVDFEYGAYNYRAFDFANHFCEYAGFDCDWKQHFPEKQHIKAFVNDYIVALCGNEEYKKGVQKVVIDLCMKQDDDDNDDKTYDAFLDSCADVILAFCCADHYFWGLWGVVQAKYSPIDFDFIQYAHDRLVSGYQHALTLIPSYLNVVCKRIASKVF